MALKIGLSALSVALRSCGQRSYLKTLAHDTLQWDFHHQGQSLKTVALTSLLDTPREVCLSLAPFVEGETPFEDVAAICTLVQIQQPRTLFEFGTFTGRTTLNMAMNAPETARIYTLDLSPQQRAELEGERWEKTFGQDIIGECFRETPYASRVTQLLDDTLKFDPRPYLGKMDFVFIDACHEYEFVRNDSEKALQMLSENGTIAWHDYKPAFPGVGRYLRDLSRQREVCWVEGTQIAFCRGRC